MTDVKAVKVEELIPYLINMFRESQKERSYLNNIDIGNVVYRALLYIASFPENDATASFHATYIWADVERVGKIGWQLHVRNHHPLGTYFMINIFHEEEVNSSYEAQVLYSGKLLGVVNWLLKKIADLDLRRRESLMLEGTDEARRREVDNYTRNVLTEESKAILKERNIEVLWSCSITNDNSLIRGEITSIGGLHQYREYCFSLRDHRFDGRVETGRKARVNNIDLFADEMNEIIQNRLEL